MKKNYIGGERITQGILSRYCCNCGKPFSCFGECSKSSRIKETNGCYCGECSIDEYGSVESYAKRKGEKIACSSRFPK